MIVTTEGIGSERKGGERMREVVLGYHGRAAEGVGAQPEEMLILQNDPSPELLVTAGLSHDTTVFTPH